MIVDPVPARGGIMANGKQSLTSAGAAAQLDRSGNHWRADASGVVTVTYAYRASGTVPFEGGAAFSTFNARQIAATELALQSWSDVTNIHFQRVGSGTGDDAYSNDATILFGNYSPYGADTGSAFAYQPGSRGATSTAGDVWVASNLSYNRTPVVGDYGQQVLVHEIGHTLGLSHPSDYDATDEADPTYSVSAFYYEDSRQYTVMSYFASANTGASLGAYAAAPQMDDIAAAQLLYGANYATRAGDTVYGFNSTADRPYYLATNSSSQLVFAVWDGGGYDTLDFSGYSQNARIDLRQGAFSDVGGSVHNIGIAVGVVIEAAIGGSGNDRLIANDNNNDLIGGAGADQISGGAGNDHLYGGGRVAVAGDGADTIDGGAGSDYIQGNAGNDVLDGGAGSDRIYGGQGNDLIEGGDGNDTINGNLGGDTISGSAGNDSLRGGQGNDSISGGAGDDVVSGDLGNDTLDGGTGFDTLSGGAGSDVFMIGRDKVDLDANPGRIGDLILDFEDGVDHLTQANGVPTIVAYALFDTAVTLATIAAYARTTIVAQTANMAVAVGYGNDTLLFTYQPSSTELDGVRLVGINAGLIGTADFV